MTMNYAGDATTVSVSRPTLPMLAHNHERVAELFRALAEPNRLSIVHCLSDAPHRVGEIAAHVGLAQSTVSAHLAVLRNAGIVAARPEGRSTWYRLNNESLESLLEAAERLVAPAGAHPAGTEREARPS